MKENKKTSLVIHGHFYQPPRENPNTGVIPKQPSASPYSDWNERIFDDCYNANVSSRYLDQDGRILNLTNNYAYISFNFGPTLLHWLDEKHPETIVGLRDADMASIKRLGHGNAMAQGFNHTILPLDHPDNARLQIEWGIQDFQYHFKRDPEGIWLPECGVNETVVQLLSEAGIKFIVLSPWQCKAIEAKDGRMVELGTSPAPYSEPYILTGTKGGTVSGFFYEPSLASGISFGHFLHSADLLYDRILELKAKDRSPLIHTATDGEIYGHHEPYGDMALAALIRKVNERDDFILDNYGSYLEKNPATRHAILKPGEDNRGSSWSCSHGVSRWYKDCGCHTGGPDNWNQKWRVGLRNALNNLGDKIDFIFSKEIDKVFKGALSAQNLLLMAGSVYCGKTGMVEFTEVLKKMFNITEEDRMLVAHLLSGMKYKHFSFTSCGFFFSDLSGIEPRQDIKYAIHAINLFQQYSDEELMIPFLSDLKMAKSNIKEIGDGLQIAQEEAEGLRGEVEATVYFVLHKTLAKNSPETKDYGRFSLVSYQEDKEWKNVTVLDKATGEVHVMKALQSSGIEQGINIYITKNKGQGRRSESYTVTSKDLPEKMFVDAFDWVDNAQGSIPKDAIMEHIKLLQVYSILLDHNSTDMDSRTLENLGLAVRCLRSLILAPSPELTIDERINSASSLISFISTFGREREKILMKSLMNKTLDRLCEMFEKNGLDETNVLFLMKVIEASRELGIEPQLKPIQNIVYPYYIGTKGIGVDKETARKAFSMINFK